MNGINGHREEAPESSLTSFHNVRTKRQPSGNQKVSPHQTLILPVQISDFKASNQRNKLLFISQPVYGTLFYKGPKFSDKHLINSSCMQDTC